MKIECPKCHVEGYLQKRANSYVVQHYQGFESGKRIYLYHKVNSMEVTEVNGSKLLEVKKDCSGIFNDNRAGPTGIEARASVSYMPKLQREPGRFWPRVRALIWEKAQQLYQQGQLKGMADDFKRIPATKAELREGEYFYTAKLIVLRDLWREKKCLPTTEEEAFQEQA